MASLHNGLTHCVVPSTEYVGLSYRKCRRRSRLETCASATATSKLPLLTSGIRDGPPRFCSPFLPVQVPDRSRLPLLIYLPGIDGTGLAAARQFPSLMEHFDLRVFVVPTEDRTSFDDLRTLVKEYLKFEIPSISPTRPVYILGESFGGILAIAAALDSPENVDRLILVNPATSFPRSLWPLVGPLIVSQVPEGVYKSALPIALAPILGNPVNLLASGLDNTEGMPYSEIAMKLGQTAIDFLALLPGLAEILPPDTLAHKLEQLAIGAEAVSNTLNKVQQRTLVLVGDRDLLIPSGEEGPRLQRDMPRVQLRIEKGRSHALLQEGGVDLVNILKEEGFYTESRKMSASIKKRAAVAFGSANPIELPTLMELDSYAERTTRLGRRLTSPVFFSTGADGVVVEGLGAIPEERPILFIGNHQTLALDLGVLCEEFLREREILLRGLAHPVIFSDAFNGSEEKKNASESDANTLAPWDIIPTFGSLLSGGGGLTPGQQRMDSSRPVNGRASFKDFMTTFGAVPVSGKNMHKLLANGESVLLFPGGVREAYKRKNEEYKLFWPEKSEFVRMAARFNAVIIPFAAVGVDDGLKVLLDVDEMERTPILGGMIKGRQSQLPQARSDEKFVAPLVAPILPPRRLYFYFKRPIQLSDTDSKNREKCDGIYQNVKLEVEEGLNWLLEKREQDPYKDVAGRLIYEGLSRGRRAPTFKIL